MALRRENQYMVVRYILLPSSAGMERPFVYFPSPISMSGKPTRANGITADLMICGGTGYAEI